jgi:hypothetical protein
VGKERCQSWCSVGSSFWGEFYEFDDMGDVASCFPDLEAQLDEGMVEEREYYLRAIPWLFNWL